MRKLTQKGFTLVELMIVVAIIGILAAIAIPNFIKFQAKSKQSEAKTNLKAVFTAEKSYFAERDSYATFTGAGFVPERGNRYSYASNPIPGGEAQTREASTLLAPTVATSATYVGGGFDVYYVDCFRLIGGACAGTTPSSPTFPTSYAQPTATAEAGVTGPAASPGSVYGTTGGIIAQAVGNVDNDAAGDVWEVGVSMALSVAGSVCADAQSGPSGVPINAWNDVNCDN
jgi:type IV pilus assembly protein PilA